eukprot:774380-Pyramimonas_sp.AAC.1
MTPETSAELGQACHGLTNEEKAFHVELGELAALQRAAGFRSFLQLRGPTRPASSGGALPPAAGVHALGDAGQ